MIAYEDLVVALKSWRARNGLPDTPPDYGDATPAVSAAAADQAAPDEIYDLSDDSGLIVAEDLGDAQAVDEYPDDYAAAPVDDQLGVIETGVEVSAESAMPAPDDYDDPPSTDAYTDYAPAEVAPYAAPAATDGYAEPPADAYAEPAPSYDDAPADAYAEPAPLAEPDDEGATVVGGDDYAMADAGEGTLEADAADVVEEVDLDAANADVPVYDDADAEEIDAAGIIDEQALAPETMDDEAPDEATVVAGEHGVFEEPEALPEPPDDPDQDR